MDTFSHTTPGKTATAISAGLRPSDTRKEIVWKQYLAAFLSSMISFSTGCVGGWSGPATPKLIAGTSGLGIRPLTMDEVSWVGSLINLGAICGCIPAGYVSFRFGRRACLLCLAWPIIVGWLLILFNQNNIWLIYVGRLISGVSYGSMNIAMPVYNNEICCDRIRGRVGTIYEVLQCLGILYVYFFGAITSIFWTSFMSLLVPIVFFCTFYWMPESPLYYVRHGMKDEAIQSIKWLYGEDCDVQEKLLRIRNALQEGMNEKINLDGSSRFQHFYRSLNKVTMKAFVLVFIIFVIQRTAGATMVLYYTDSIFEMTRSTIAPSSATVLIGILSTVGAATSMMAVDVIGRRFLLISTFFVMALSMLVLLAYVQLVIVSENQAIINLPIKEIYGYIPAITLCLFLFAFRLGVSPIPWFMTPEIVPTEAQKWVPAVIVCFTWGSSFFISKFFLLSLEVFGQVAVYSFFFVMCLLGGIYTTLFIPETKNKSREEIQRALGATTVAYDGQ